MKELKEYLAPELIIVEIGDYVFTTNSTDDNNTEDIYSGEGNQWWEK